ncbi:MAG: 3-methyladenine DNA glycosylase [Candidatus Phosphoribacter sp.]|nr:3-methyladenine DNA glycosylase [Actinomycetales bacterium]
MATLERATWSAAADAHAHRIDALTQGHRSRRVAGEVHPIEDFLFVYYPFKPAAIRRWHPGPGLRLADAAHTERAQWRHYRGIGDDVEFDHTSYLQARGHTLRFVRDLLARTAARPPQLGCFALHEWAMVYRLPSDQVRHASWPLRLSSAETDAVVDANPLRCTHFDAFRFFTEPARPRNALTPTRARQAELDQPGCLHATMDLYKSSMKLAPAVPSELVADTLELAMELRLLDMRASPYDLRALGVEPIAVETPEGKAAYVAEQRRYAARGQILRARLISACDAVTALDPEVDAAVQRQ